MKLTNKKALVTGASKGIGAATAIALAKEGCSVAINYKTDGRSAKKVLAACNAHSEGNIIIKANVSDKVAVQKMMREVQRSFSSLHILVNNVGIFDPKDDPTNDEVFEKLFKTNFLSHVLVVKHALKLMKRGKIINVSSIHGRSGYGRPSASAYASLKSALDSYTKNLAKKLAPSILVNAVAPGRVATPMWGDPSPLQQKRLGEAHLIRRMIQPEEVADAIVFLAKNDAVCAEILTIDGGYRLKDLS